MTFDGRADSIRARVWDLAWSIIQAPLSAEASSVVVAFVRIPVPVTPASTSISTTGPLSTSSS